MECTQKDFEKFEKFENFSNYLPKVGDGTNRGTQAATAISMIVYKWFNDGDVFDNRFYLQGWANDISGSANWLYNYIPETQPILNRIKQITTEDEYTELLYDLTELVDDKIVEMLSMTKIGDAYVEDGPFRFDYYANDEDNYSF